MYELLKISRVPDVLFNANLNSNNTKLIAHATDINTSHYSKGFPIKVRSLDIPKKQ